LSAKARWRNRIRNEAAVGAGGRQGGFRMTIVLIDDHPLLSLGLAQGLSALGMEPLAIDPAPTQLLLDQLLLARPRPDLIVLDYAMPAVSDTVTLVGVLTKEGFRVIVLSGSDDEVGLARCLKAGADAVISKDEPVDEIIDVIAMAASGRRVRPNLKAITIAELAAFDQEREKCETLFRSLSASEKCVLAFLMRGQNAEQIADARFVSVATIRTQIRSILNKLGANSQLQAVALAHDNAFTAPDSLNQESA